ncbi:lysine 2,3-aminomutase [Chlorobium sp. N1]|uniref:KamA family radical SAM protein n=1 Tax=Chlorobium sp. N1 TaxID=2491138 RepID=UPI00103BB686|nr:lysine 2,3-aminomutase [Chlorobium sp. N1]TCD46815.1 lysine 2,3-aminomutase [Chlorobium sp. N1]
MTSYRSYTAANIHELPQYDSIPEEQIRAIRTVARVYPFRVNSHVAEHLIDWSNIPDDPLFRLSFPQAEMLSEDDYGTLSALLTQGAPAEAVSAAVREIQFRQNPNPAGQKELNTPSLDGEPLHGMQHKYRESVLFFPLEAQVCHAYCTYCFRWPQFSGLENLRFQDDSVTRLVGYLRLHPEVRDVIFTGGDPMVMPSETLASYIRPLLQVPTLKTIRIGTKALSWWPLRFVAEPDNDALLALFEEIVGSGRQLALMAHISHPRELENPLAETAVRRIRSTGAVIRSQSPVVRHINDDAGTWEAMWQKQLQLGIIPYYMFLERDTGPKEYFAVPLVEALGIFNRAYRRMSGLGRTVRGPSMSCSPGKVAVDGIAEVGGQKVFVLKFIQGRNSDWVGRVFFARYDADATWIDDLVPAFGDEPFFFEAELRRLSGS